MKKVYDGIKVAILVCGKDPILESETEYNDHSASMITSTSMSFEKR